MLNRWKSESTDANNPLINYSNGEALKQPTYYKLSKTNLAALQKGHRVGESSKFEEELHNETRLLKPLAKSPPRSKQLVSNQKHKEISWNQVSHGAHQKVSLASASLETLQSVETNTDSTLANVYLSSDTSLENSINEKVSNKSHSNQQKIQNECVNANSNSEDSSVEQITQIYKESTENDNEQGIANYEEHVGINGDSMDDSVSTGNKKVTYKALKNNLSDTQAIHKLYHYLASNSKSVSFTDKENMGSLRMAAPPPTGGDLELVRRVRKKFEQLEHDCLERYRCREEKVVHTLDFCMTALEQLRSWAVFAIFPTDENQKEKYVQFVIQRYHCVIEPLRLFLTAIEKCTANEPIKSHRPRTPRDSTIEKDRHSTKMSPREPRKTKYGGLGDISIQRGNRFKNSIESPRLGHPQNPPPLDLENLEGPEENGDDSIPADELESERTSSLREEIIRISKEHNDEGVFIKNAVMDKLRKCRKDTKTLYKWGQGSLLDLQDILDEALADELYFMVRSKMARILATISIFEEAAEHIERNLSNHFPPKPNGSVSERGTSSTGKKRKNSTSSTSETLTDHSNNDLSNSCSNFSAAKALSKSQERLGPSDGSSNPSNSGRFDSLNDLDLRIEIPTRDSPTGSEGNELEDLLLAWSFNGGNVGHVRLAADKSEPERHSDASTPRSSSTPEPPISPRPRALVNHPKIMKDKLHSMALPSKFPGVASGRFSASW